MTDRKNRALKSLLGIAVGDALGERFFGQPNVVLKNIYQRCLPPASWLYTDDTEMAISIVDNLLKFKGINQDYLAKQFAKRFNLRRGYGSSTREILLNIRNGAFWKDESEMAFGGSGSYGNGAAMRAAPIGAFFGKDTGKVLSNARLSAEITHSHIEGIAGAQAVSLAASYYNIIKEKEKFNFTSYLDFIILHLPNCLTKQGITKLKTIDRSCHVKEIVKVVGNGSNITSQDTIPYVIWASGLNYFNFQEAFWYTVEGLGDRDTTCAMVCGIVANSSQSPIPEEWLKRTEKLPRLNEKK